MAGSYDFESGIADILTLGLLSQVPVEVRNEETNKISSKAIYLEVYKTKLE